MPSRIAKKKEVDSERSQLSERDIRLLLVLCAELVNFCAKVANQIDPAAAAMLAYVRDDIRFESKSLLH
jgi:hypothetical protein